MKFKSPVLIPVLITHYQVNYLKVTFHISPPEEWFRDLFIASLGEIGFDSFVESASGFEAYIIDSEYDKFKIEKIQLFTDNRFSISYTVEVMENKNWNEEWEKNYFSPLLIAGKCLVRAPFHTEYPRAPIEIIIEPNMAFGTGNHETTSMMIESILVEEVKNKSVLDMGCGTGILSILASMLGAASVTAIDVDEWAYRGAIENAALNNISNMKIIQGDATKLTLKKYDLIFANIQRNVIINDLSAYESVLANKGKILLSGFYTQDLENIKNCAAGIGLRFLKLSVKNYWVMAVFSKD